ncbi:MAG: HEPN domain-containing protein [Acidobacteria bacterium]|nr:HEPN domain-containing protein [Acidobacteriota bacterium]
MNRAADWLRQAKKDLKHSVHARADGDFEWSCFAAQQAAEKSLKAAFQKRGKEGWGHSLMGLCQALADDIPVPPEIAGAARRLDKHYIPSRYPNGFASGAPSDYYADEDAEAAIKDADEIIRFCEGLRAGACQS